MTSSFTKTGAAKWTVCGALALGICACSTERAAERPPTLASHRDRWSADRARDDIATNVRVSDELRRECQLPNVPSEAPHFSAGQSTLPPVGRSILDDVANCLTDGPLEGRAVLVIGRSDPRGPEEQNQKLSQNRAEATKSYLVKRGVASDNVRTLARGERGARGTDEATWAGDRRVDIELVAANVSAADATPNPIIEGTRLQSMSKDNRFVSENGEEASPSSAAKPRVGAAQ